MSEYDYTPTTDEVRRNQIEVKGAKPREVVVEEFDRWYEAEKRKWQAEALREAAQYLDADRGGNSASYKLNIRADRIEKGVRDVD